MLDAQRGKLRVLRILPPMPALLVVPATLALWVLFCALPRTSYTWAYKADFGFPYTFAEGLREGAVVPYEPAAADPAFYALGYFWRDFRPGFFVADLALALSGSLLLAWGIRLSVLSRLPKNYDCDEASNTPLQQPGGLGVDAKRTLE